jgi:hypothetical protein
VVHRKSSFDFRLDTAGAVSYCAANLTALN